MESSSRYTPRSDLSIRSNGRGNWNYPKTLGTLEFLERENGTELILTHEGFPDENMCDEHEEGWGECLDSLLNYLESA